MTMPPAVDGFSLTNRLLLYTSLMLAPAQFVSGLGSNSPNNLGFLAYNWYTQIKWYQSIRTNQLHALSLLPVHFNTINAIAYLGGVSAGNLAMAIILSAGTAGVMILNTISAWICWKTLPREGFGSYRFFFFGWRTLNPGWHKFILLWQIFDTFFAIGSIGLAFRLALENSRVTEKDLRWYWKYLAILPGIAVMLFLTWPLILWTELLVSANDIESPTDMTAVWMFVVQVGTLLAPDLSCCLKCFRFITRRSSSNPGDTAP